MRLSRFTICCLVEAIEDPNAVALFETLCARGVSIVKSKDERRKKLQQVRCRTIDVQMHFFFF